MLPTSINLQKLFKSGINHLTRYCNMEQKPFPYLTVKLFKGYLYYKLNLPKAELLSLITSDQEETIAYQIMFLNALNYPRLCARLELEEKMFYYRQKAKEVAPQTKENKVVLTAVAVPNGKKDTD